MKFTNILVPVSGIPADEESLHLAMHIARQDKAKALAIHVIEVQRNLPVDAEATTQLERGEKILARAEQFAKNNKGNIDVELLQARSAGAALVNEARERRIDLIIVGAPYRNPLGEFVLGTTTQYLLKNAPCRVWVCRELLPNDSSKPA